jgi:hypothetical protein
MAKLRDYIKRISENSRYTQRINRTIIGKIHQKQNKVKRIIDLNAIEIKRIENMLTDTKNRPNANDEKTLKKIIDLLQTETNFRDKQTLETLKAHENAELENATEADKIKEYVKDLPRNFDEFEKTINELLIELKANNKPSDFREKVYHNLSKASVLYRSINEHIQIIKEKLDKMAINSKECLAVDQRYGQLNTDRENTTKEINGLIATLTKTKIQIDRKIGKV